VTTDSPEYFFAVAQQPNIVNTASLNRIAISRPLRYFALNSSVATRSEGMAEEILSPTGMGATCTVSQPQPPAVILSGTRIGVCN
jgi:hypothetical protein